jgi:hypothetical protein
VPQVSLKVKHEITAHSRYLSVLQPHPSRPWLLSAAQDATAAVWRLPQAGGERPELVTSLLWNNALLTGGCFLTDGSLALVAYGQPLVRLYHCARPEARS